VQLPAKKEVRLATLTVNYVPKGERQLKQKGLEAKISAAFREVPDIRFFTLNDNGQRGMQLIVSGPDQNVVVATAAKLEREMASIPTLVNVYSTAPLDRPEIRIRPKVATAAELGVATDLIADTVRVGTIGDIGANLAKFDAGDRQIPIRVQLPESLRGDRALIEILRVPVKNGAAVPLSAVADIELGQGPTASIVTTVRFASRSRATCRARTRSARCSSSSTPCRRRRTCRLASSSGRPGTPRS